MIVLFGATGDLAKRKLLPGLLHLSRAGLVPDCRIVGTSLDDLDDDGFRALRPGGVRRVRPRRRSPRTTGTTFAGKLTYVVPERRAPRRWPKAVSDAEGSAAAASRAGCTT